MTDMECTGQTRPSIADGRSTVDPESVWRPSRGTELLWLESWLPVETNTYAAVIGRLQCAMKQQRYL